MVKCKKGFGRIGKKCVKIDLSKKYVNEYQSSSFQNPSVMKTHILSDTPFVSGIRTYATKAEAKKDFNKTKNGSKKLGIYLEKHKIKKYNDAVRRFVK